MSDPYYARRPPHEILLHPQIHVKRMKKHLDKDSGGRYNYDDYVYHKGVVRHGDPGIIRETGADQ
jgi:hypothetical protein